MPKVFTTKIKKGKAIGAQTGLSDDLTKVFSILENLEGIGGVEVKRDGIYWRIAITSSMAGGSSGGGVYKCLCLVLLPVESVKVSLIAF